MHAHICIVGNEALDLPTKEAKYLLKQLVKQLLLMRMILHISELEKIPSKKPHVLAQLMQTDILQEMLLT